MTFEDCCVELMERGYLKVHQRGEAEPTMVFTLAGEVAAVKLLQLESTLSRQIGKPRRDHARA